MSDYKYERCATCGEFGWVNTHMCPPAWIVWSPEHGQAEDDARTVRAWDAERATEKWAEEFDADGDYTIVAGHEATVYVRSGSGEGPIESYVVKGESVPEYYARKVEAREGKP